MADGPAWAWSDAWVLAAVAGYGERGCSLTELVAAGDAINHAIFLAAEVEQGVRRLSGAGLITAQEEAFRLTDRGRDLVTGGRGGLHGQVDHLLARLHRVPVVEQAWDLDPAAFDRAKTAGTRVSRRADGGR